MTFDPIPVAHNQWLIAVPAEGGGVAGPIVNITKINVVETRLNRDPARTLQRLRRRRGSVEHFVGRMERREMQRDIPPQFSCHPLRQRRQFLIRVISFLESVKL